ncbi:hypothetical protein GCM10027570_03510 [Streptomonospora sediminis]
MVRSSVAQRTRRTRGTARNRPRAAAAMRVAQCEFDRFDGGERPGDHGSAAAAQLGMRFSGTASPNCGCPILAGIGFRYFAQHGRAPPPGAVRMWIGHPWKPGEPLGWAV